MSRFFLDSEFNEDGKTIELISIALVCDDGRKFYAVSNEFDPWRCDPWVKANVLPLLPPAGAPEWKTRAQIRDELLAFALIGDGTTPEFWAYYADYDWVVLCQLFGRMVDLPPGFPMYCNDLRQTMTRLEILSRDLPETKGAVAHNALHDAIELRDRYDFITKNYGRGARI